MSLERAERLERQLKSALQTKGDVLMMYRRWLDEHGIPAEEGGWPSEEAYNQSNVRHFIEDAR